MIDSSACIDRYLMFGKSYQNQGSTHPTGHIRKIKQTNFISVRAKVEEVVGEFKKFQDQHDSVNIEVAFAVFSNDVRYVTRTSTVEFNSYDASEQ